MSLKGKINIGRPKNVMKTWMNCVNMNKCGMKANILDDWTLWLDMTKKADRVMNKTRRIM